MKKILLVDDNEQDRVLYKRYLSRHPQCGPMEFYEAGYAEEALALYQSVRPDCVLLDYNLHDTDGLTLLTELKAVSPTADHLCVVMITGGGSEQLAVRALNNGATDYLIKQQFDQELLCKTVMYAIEKNEWQQRQTQYHEQLRNVNSELRASVAELTDARQQIGAQNAMLTTTNEELATTNAQLVRTNQDLDNFVYSASHDLRQPVDNLRGLFDELHAEAVVADPAAEQMWRLFDQSLQALTATITGLAEVVQLARPAVREPSESVALAEITQQVLQTLHLEMEVTQARVETAFEVPTLLCGRSHLNTILLNLVSNALKYHHSERAPQVHIRSYAAEGGTVLEVQDNGLGIDLGVYRQELFQLFRRFHPDVSAGTGVGLFLVNRLVQSEGGRIEVDSQQGLGTTFRLYFPA
ncbi:ATP-binding response regulator [Hymenobacter arizonensis]|uniref:histidine kinase n=1 Tax=Hymenobacter arizonensis TaxID=1227077 RepID=A0A1I5ZAX0_HYMAR|nr:hybrid sensor histidine kinase/response regulator [Hymenobacter arizonensis]SFQ53656.1 Histidine kinase-, DNA gyrase B-, and HSP90-like ATPase [Hymenobacter arizonensis]